ncbi:hypothetical protein DZK27_04010 [Rhodobacteraceae bacterium 63075]|nr:hypothetical protein DZK27_04010 [Rhodobacteraceae bacterium 63075]
MALFSLLGLGSAYAVNLAGFLVFLPRQMWGLVDANFVTSYFLRFSAMLALAFLASRYSGYMLTSLFSFICFPVAVTRLLIKKSGRRLIRIMGYRAAVDGRTSMLLRHDAQERDGSSLADLEAIAKWVYQSEIARTVVALVYISGRVRGRVGYRVDYYTIPLQLLVVLAVLSAVYTTIQGSLILLALAVFLVFALSPTPYDIYYDKPYYEANIPLLTVLKFNLSKLISIQKVTLLALTISFAGGVLHHLSLVRETRMLKFSGEVDVSGSLVMTSNSGFVIHSSEFGYKFIPIEGTQIEELVKH